MDRTRLHPFRPTVAIALACLASVTLARGVRNVSQPGAPSYLTIDAAVAAAVDGDVLLVANGTYPGFTIDGLGVSVYALPGASVVVNGTVHVRNVPAGSSVVLSRITATGQTTATSALPALQLSNNAGFVRIEDCTATGGAGPAGTTCHPYGSGAHGASISSSPRVELQGCTVRGGGGFADPYPGDYECEGGDGGDAISAQGSSIALYDCTLEGGAGGQAGCIGGDGGDGLSTPDWGIFASGSIFRGGRGGDAWDYLCGPGGVGGNGLLIGPIAGAQLVDNVHQGGAGGFSWTSLSYSPSGVGIAGTGYVNQIPRQSRRIECTAVAIDGATLAVTITGEPGDQIHLASAIQPGHVFDLPRAGMRLVPMPPKISAQPIVTLPPSGSAVVGVPLPSIPGSLAARTYFLQGIAYDASGNGTWTSPHTLLLLNREAAPDCNGNATNDLVDMLLGAMDCDSNLVPDTCDPDCNGNGQSDGCDIVNGTPDCNGNQVPDSCDLASGASADCNGNSVPDTCDIAAGLLTDLNGNGIADACEPSNQTRYVDDDAPPGGNGTLAHPYRTLREAIVASLTGDTVIVLDGVYTGADNRALGLHGSDIVVRSLNGAAHCTIDLEGAGRAFDVHQGETRAARIEGFTIRGGREYEGGAIRIAGAGPTITQCVFVGNGASRAGGALTILGTSGHPPRIADCTFVENLCPTYAPDFGAGGAILAGSSFELVGCSFLRNAAKRGGAITSFGGPVRIARCSFLDNTAQEVAGAIYAVAVYSPPGPLTVDGCLFAGNDSASGAGAIFLEGNLGGPGILAMTNSTLGGNRGSGAGGALSIGYLGSATIVNSILWRNEAGSGVGSQIELFNGGSASVSWSILQAGAAGVAMGGTFTDGPGNVDGHPGWIDGFGPDGDALTGADGDYRLEAGALSIDAGDNVAIASDVLDLDGDGDVLEPAPYDLDGNLRRTDDPAVADTGNGVAPIVDKGAFERQP